MKDKETLQEIDDRKNPHRPGDKEKKEPEEEKILHSKACLFIMNYTLSHIQSFGDLPTKEDIINDILGTDDTNFDLVIEKINKNVVKLNEDE